MRARWRVPVAVLVSVAAVSACSSETVGPAERLGGSEVMSVVASAEGLELRNDDTEARNFLVYEAELAALVDPNLNPEAAEGWIRIEAGKALTVPLAEIPGWTPAASAVVVHSWRRSVAHPVGSGVQWLAEGWMTVRVEL